MRTTPGPLSPPALTVAEADKSAGKSEPIAGHENDSRSLIPSVPYPLAVSYPLPVPYPLSVPYPL